MGTRNDPCVGGMGTTREGSSGSVEFAAGAPHAANGPAGCHFAADSAYSHLSGSDSPAPAAGQPEV